MKIEIVRGELMTLNVRPGDTVVLSVDERLRDDIAMQIKDQLQKLLPDGVKAIVLGKGLTLSIVTRAEIDAASAGKAAA